MKPNYLIIFLLVFIAVYLYKKVATKQGEPLPIVPTNDIKTAPVLPVKIIVKQPLLAARPIIDTDGGTRYNGGSSGPKKGTRNPDDSSFPIGWSDEVFSSDHFN